MRPCLLWLLLLFSLVSIQASFTVLFAVKQSLLQLHFELKAEPISRGRKALPVTMRRVRWWLRNNLDYRWIKLPPTSLKQVADSTRSTQPFFTDLLFQPFCLPYYHSEDVTLRLRHAFKRPLILRGGIQLHRFAGLCANLMCQRIEFSAD
jgi:hypothetical protein